MEVARPDVLIIGSGMAGSALACALRNSGLEVALLDRRTTPLDTARGDHLQPATLELLSAWGVLPRLLAAGAEQRPGTRWFDAQGQLVLESRVDGLELKFPHFLFLNHERIADVLLQTALESPGTRLLPPCRDWNLLKRESAAGIEVSYPGGEHQIILPRVLVGADGTGSRLRSQAGIGTALHRYQHPIAVLFGRRRIPLEQAWLEVYLSHGPMMSVIPRVGGASKIGLPIKAGELSDWRGATEGELLVRMRELVPSLELESLRFAAIYPPVRVAVEHWTAGNVVLLGDACHAMHPARSMGMNACLRTADGLARRLQGLPSAAACGEVAAALQDFESGERPRLEIELEANHRAGEEMDLISGEAYESLLARLQGVAGVAQAREALALQSAGYSPGKPG
ncbi:MAG: FAD-dependent oxidoreductase [Steroidobacteraceae bacterium]